MCGAWGGWLGLNMIQVVWQISQLSDLLEVTGNSIRLSMSAILLFKRSAHSLTHPFTHSLIHSLTHSLTEINGQLI